MCKKSKDTRTPLPGRVVCVSKVKSELHVRL
jgi:hypothetical protein